MLYKVTPMMTPAEPPKKAAPLDGETPKVAKEPRKRRKSAVYDVEGHEVLITMMCLKCKAMKPLTMFGLRKMADGAIRNQPWCRTCRSGASTKKKREEGGEADLDATVEMSEPVAETEAPAVTTAPVTEPAPA